MPASEEMIARACYETARAFVQLKGDNSRPSWDNLDDQSKAVVLRKMQQIRNGQMSDPPDGEDILYKNMINAMSK